MEKNKLKAGDWCFHEYELKLIKRLDKDQIGEVTCGIMNTSGYRLIDNCRPLTIRNKNISGEFRYWYRELKKINQIRNWPDLARLLEQMWLDAVDDSDEKITDHYTKLREMCRSIKEEAENVSAKSFNGINVF